MELRAGDVLVYVNYLMHWGSRYTREPKRRTLHGGHTIYPRWVDLDFTLHLSVEARDWFELWAARTAALQNHTERALRAVLDRDRQTYLEALDVLRPARDQPRSCKSRYGSARPPCTSRTSAGRTSQALPLEFTPPREASHAISLNWGPTFAERFTTSEAARIWQAFGALDDQLRAPDGETTCPGYQSGPIPYNLGGYAQRLQRGRLHRELGAHSVGRSGPAKPRHSPPLVTLAAASSKT